MRDTARRLIQEAQTMTERWGNPFYLVLGLCEQGHLALMCSEPARQYLERAQELAVPLQSGPDSEISQALARLQRAVDAFEAGRPLFRGELWEDIPQGLQGWLLKMRQAPAPGRTRGRGKRVSGASGRERRERTRKKH